MIKSVIVFEKWYNNAEAYINRGIAYSTQKEHKRAIANYNQAIALAPNNAEAYINRGIAYSTQKDHEPAIAGLID